LARLAIAYAIALQGLLGAWAGIASAHDFARDASMSLCRTLAADDAREPDGAAPTHCAVMCLSGACSNGASPTPVSVATEYAPPRLAYVPGDERETVRLIAPLSALSARGPPSIV
jgi:hypothetical protein